ncbi:MAG: GNAT family N-acetyltransferase [Actinomycetota bacterium]|nr:GNAT family N-acetyltransferase [Acidimicrobiaceae bacterium]MBD16899.1 GNAT family N-acetyltransferase [Actinomycetota bacterium]MEC7116397.1 GNAT family N-acetyltransferase [Actinomycetota bacterium]MEC7292183.1 GNAT family N-acetyltransferase [Actinomycetota bacterium]MEC7578797.1 GNAT family N-acetyltransferase [Actinomycetota bacterium]|tara:strand:+ start:1562 stop:1996 length:435 start_codon:yes stop_codon:yes gene_type:complete
MVSIRPVTEVTESLTDAYRVLIPQLSSSSSPPTGEALQRIIESDSAQILIAENENGEILGTMTIIIFQIPTGIRAWIEDVVVDSSVRGKGIGKKLNLAALELAKQAGAKTVDLTSRPARQEANQLYRSIGFVERETNVYRFSFE